MTDAKLAALSGSIRWPWLQIASELTKGLSFNVMRLNGIGPKLMARDEITALIPNLD
ncbi:MAG: hypothetical protein ACREWJ_04380 [Rhodoferax sp.]